MESELKQRQESLNQEYEKKGLTDEVLDKQIEINKLRAKHDIQDQNETIYKEYVQ